MPTPRPRALAAAALLVAAALPASAQQFQHQSGLIPGPARWSEGVEAADVDRDGDLDLFFADGDGFASAGAKRQNVLVINKLVETASLAFADESVARLGVHESNAKGVTNDANVKDVVVFRVVEGQQMAALYDLGAIRRGTYKDPTLFSQDLVVVGDTPRSRLVRELGPVIASPLILLLQSIL